MRWLKKSLNDQAWSVVISDAKSGWRSITSEVPQNLLVGQILFNFFVSDLDDGTECTLSNILRLIQNWKVANSPEGYAAIRRNINRLEKWADRNLMKFKNGYSKVQQLKNHNPMCKHIVCQLTGSQFGKGEPWISGGQQAVYEPVRHAHSA